MTKKEKAELIIYARILNTCIIKKSEKKIPVNTYGEVLEHIRLRINPALFTYIDGVKVRERTKRDYEIGEIFYTKDIAIVPISRNKEAYFNLTKIG